MASEGTSSQPVGPKASLQKFLSSHMHALLRAWTIDPDNCGVVVEFSNRLSRSLGRCDPAKGVIRLADFLKSQPREIVSEALAHELAHWAARRIHGPKIRPHGPEWRELMQMAGFEPRVRIPLSDQVQDEQAQAALQYVHTCLICHATRVASRPVKNWRCPNCYAAGLSGEFSVHTIPPRTRRED